MMRENCRVLLIIEGTYPWYRGGVSEWVYQYLKNLSDYNVDILQIATDEFQGMDPKEALYPLTDNIGSFTRISPPDNLLEWEEEKENWLSQVPISVFSQDFNVVHVANTGFAGWLGVQISKKTQIPLVLTEHAIYWKEVEKGAVALECGYQIPADEELKKQSVELFKSIAREVYQHSSKVISVSKVNISEQEKLGAETTIYIPNGISKQLIEENKNRSEKPTIGWIGRCAEMKNPKLFFEVVNAFKTINFEASFVMMLSDANETNLEYEVKELSKQYPSVQMIWNEDAKSYLSELDMLCITSHNESQPLVMFEALSNKALPFGWQVGDLTNEFGFVVPQSESGENLVAQIKNLWSDQTKFNHTVDEKFDTLKEYHVWDKIFSRYDQLFQNLIEETQVATA